MKDDVSMGSHFENNKSKSLIIILSFLTMARI